jgi:hypothetical protein
VAVASSLLACSMLESHRAFETRSAPPATRFAVLLPNALAPVPAELSGATDRVLGQITRYVGAQDRKLRVVDPLEVRRLWLASIAEADESDTVSHDFDGAMKLFARNLGGPAVFDALVVSSLVYREGRLRNRIVKWDGVARRLPAVGEDPALGEEANPIPESFDALVPVVSLNVMVFDASGELLFENYGGVDLAHSFTFEPGEEGGLRIALRDPLLEERRFLREGVEIAFDPYLPRGDAGEW